MSYARCDWSVIVVISLCNINFELRLNWLLSVLASLVYFQRVRLARLNSQTPNDSTEQLPNGTELQFLNNKQVQCLEHLFSKNRLSICGNILLMVL